MIYIGKYFQRPNSKKLYDQEMSKFFAEEMETTIVEAKEQRNTTHRRLKTLL